MATKRSGITIKGVCLGVMTSDSGPQLINIPQGSLLYDPMLVDSPRAHLLDPDWLVKHGTLQAVNTGRGDAWMVDFEQQHWVLRRYLRGGLVSRFNRDSYLGWRVTATRAWREWQLLYQLWQKNLPVARPVAACIRWPHGRFWGLYQASILIQRIADARTLAEILQQQPLDVQGWQLTGQCIADFHRHNVYHADLNANNILLDGSGRVYLIDFDRGAIRKHGAWKSSNLQRLKRSLLKLQTLHETFNFSEQDWRDMLAAYEASCAS